MIRKKNFLFFFFGLFLIISSCSKDHTYTIETKDGVRRVHNIKPRSNQPIARLEFIRQIGELEPEDEKYMFQQPLSINRDNNGFNYILDSKACLIKKFDRNGRYISEFGRKG
jgi:hypothetical protein